ncbi:LamG-like jellyroll fold domain-containing protein [Geofilum rubicundum]|nr:LamG-like jellyroll fold domain-containing protein [Geofilum rubicundum]
MKNLLLRGWYLLAFFMMLGVTTVNGQITDTAKVIDPALTGKHLVHAEVTFFDGDENGQYDAIFTLSQDTVRAWADYVTTVAFYHTGIAVKNGFTGSLVYTNQLIPVPGQPYDIWMAVDIPNGVYTTWVQTEGMEAPLMIFKDAGFNHSNFTELNLWSAIHNGSGQDDYLTVQNFELTTNSDPSLASLSANVGVMSPEFNPMEQAYELAVPYGTTAITVDALANGLGATVEIFDGLGELVGDDGVVAFAGDGISLEIQVKAFDGTSASYYLDIFVDDGSSEATLSDLTPSIGTLSPAFSQAVESYTLTVPMGVTSVTLAGTPTYPQATVSGDGAIALTGGAGTASVAVQSFDGSANKTYTVNVVEADGLNYAIQMAGVDGATSHIDISGLDLKTLPYTVEMWIKPEGAQTNNAGLFYSRTGDDNAGAAYASGWQGSGKLRFMTNIASNDYGTVTDVTAATDVWHHVAVVLTEKTSTIYLNGTPYTREIESPAFDYSVGKLYLGWDTGAANRAFKGAIDEVRVWNDSLNAETIMNNRYEVLTGAEAGLIGYWNFDLNNEHGVYDWTGGVNGVITGGTIVESFPRANLNLTSLTVDQGNLFPGLQASVTEYTVILPVGTTSFVLSAEAESASATITGAGTIDVTGERGSTTFTVTEGAYSQEFVVNYQVQTELTLKHSYTFADGTAKDVVGQAHGTLNGGTIVAGEYIAAEEGEFISLPGDLIAINTYASLTMEVYFKAGDGINGANTMISWFGNTQNNYGIDGLYLSHKSRTAISAGNYSSPWSNEDGVNSLVMDDGLPHYMVATLTNDSISLYVDGTYIGSTLLRDHNKIYNLSNELAYLCKSGYSGDETWNGSILEYNIYSGVMDGDMVAQRSVAFPIEDGSEDATLLDLMLDGVSIDGFASTITDYVVEVADENYEPFISAEAKHAGATATVVQANEIPGTATVEVLAADGETTLTYTIEFIRPTTSIGEAKEEAVVVYPTITSGDFTIKTKGQAGMVTVYDMTGRVVISQPLQSSEDTISLQRAGMYILKVDTKEGVNVFKVIKRD